MQSTKVREEFTSIFKKSFLQVLIIFVCVVFLRKMAIARTSRKLGLFGTSMTPHSLGVNKLLIVNEESPSAASKSTHDWN